MLNQLRYERAGTSAGRAEGKYAVHTPVEVIPGAQGEIAGELFAVLRHILPPQHLSLGGGTVLAARWGHRTSLDVDLFCEPASYARLTPAERAAIERAIRKIPGCAQEQTWCEDIATYTEISGIESTVLPRVTVLKSTPATTLNGTDLQLQSSAQILYGKIAWRMYEGGEIAVRDAYDLACAGRHDPDALSRACAQTSPHVLATIRAVIEQLPKGWSDDTEKPLLRARYAWSESELTDQTLAALQGAPEAVRD